MSNLNLQKLCGWVCPWPWTFKGTICRQFTLNFHISYAGSFKKSVADDKMGYFILDFDLILFYVELRLFEFEPRFPFEFYFIFNVFEFIKNFCVILIW